MQTPSDAFHLPHLLHDVPPVTSVFLPHLWQVQNFRLLLNFLKNDMLARS
ncbi:hypothetical protein ACPSKX_11420 [Moritella viscosa]